MGTPKIRVLAFLALAASWGLEAQTSTNPVLRRQSLPARTGPNALSGHDRADLRRDWDLYWFGGKLSPDYIDFKNRQAAHEVQRWRRLLPKAAPGGHALPAIQPAAASAGGPSWINLGPASNLTDASWSSIDSGRPVAVVPHPTTSTTLYLATSGGGVFKCVNADLNATGDWSWVSITDDLPASSSSGNISIGAMALSPVDPDVLYLGLGDLFDAEGRGFYTSPDGGATWTTATAGLGNATRSYAILPLSANRILWGTNDGLKISNDGGATFAAATGAPAAGQVWTVRKFNATDLICSVESTSGKIYSSSDAGATWSAATISGVTFPMGRITLAAAGDGATAYAIVEDTTTTSSTRVARGVLKSTDKGHTWTWVAAPTISGGLFQGTGPSMSTDGGQGWYNHGLGVDPTNPARIVVGSNLALYRSLNGGQSWTQLTHWYGSGRPYAHADNHATAWSNGTLYVANDGGLAILRDPWRATVPTTADDLTFIDNRRNKGLSSHLVYNVGSTTAVTPTDSRWRLTLGLQDNGTRVRQGSGTDLGASGTFEDMIGGDGFGTLIHPANGNLMLGSLYYTRIYKSTNGGATPFTSSSTGIAESNDSALAPFNPKIAFGAASTPDTVYTFVNNKVYKSTDFGNNWSAMAMAGFDGSRFLRNVNGSRSSNAVGAASSGGRFWITYNDGASWADSGDITGGTFNTSYIWFNTENDQIVYGATVAPNATAHHLFKSTNGGGTWTPIDGAPGASNGLPFGIPVHVIQNQPGHANTLFAGTDFGVYRSTDGGATWARYGNNLPMVAVRDLYIASNGSFLRAGTYGRGVWELQPLSISLDRTTATVNPSATTTFTASVTDFTADNKVNWTVSTNGGTVNPSQTATGVAATYTAPATPGIYTVTATTNEPPAVSITPVTVSATVAVYTPASVVVTLTPTTKTLLPGASFTFSASVANAPDQSVTWSASGGSITPGGIFTAPLTAGSYTITAASNWPGGTAGAATVTVKTLDLDNDGTVDLRDLLFFAKHFGSANAVCDLNGDGSVDDADLGILLAGL